MEQISVNKFNVIELSTADYLNVNGGTYESGYAAGQAARKWFDTAVVEWQILRWIFL